MSPTSCSTKLIQLHSAKENLPRKTVKHVLKENGYQISMISKVYKHHAQIPKFSVQDFCSKCEQICRKLCICLHLLKKSFSENFIFLKKMVTIISPEAQITDTNQIFTMKKSEGQCIYVTFKVSLNGHVVNSNLRGSDLHLT